MDRLEACAKLRRTQREMDLLSDSRGLYSVGCYRDVSRQAVLYDPRIRNDWWVPIGDYGVAYALCQQEILTAGDTAPYVEADRVGVVCRVLLGFRDGYCLAKSACALCFPNFWVRMAFGDLRFSETISKEVSDEITYSY